MIKCKKQNAKVVKLFLDMREGVDEGGEEVGEAFGGVVVEVAGRAAHVVEHGRGVAVVDEDAVLFLGEIPVAGAGIAEVEQLLGDALDTALVLDFYKGQILGLETEILDENLAGELGHRHQTEALEPLADGDGIDVLAFLTDIDA